MSEAAVKSFTCACGYETDDWDRAHTHRKKHPAHSYRIWASPDQQYEFTSSDKPAASDG